MMLTMAYDVPLRMALIINIDNSGQEGINITCYEKIY